MTNAPKRKPVATAPPDLPFDMTQEIDPSFGDLLHRAPEPTLSPADFVDFELKAPPRGDKPRR